MKLPDFENLEDVKKHIEFHEQKYRDGCGKSGYALAFMYAEGNQLKEEIKSAIGVSDKLALSYFVRSFSLLEREAEAGDGESMHLIAMYYQTGTPPVSPDQDLFKHWTDRSAAAGYAVLDDLLAIYGDPKSKHYSLEKAVGLRKLING